MVVGGGEDSASSDEWALQYINVSCARNIMEAFDEDASGFVTIKEANDFTNSRPLDWRWVPGIHYPVRLTDMNRSLLHWLAYWAVGDCHRSTGVMALD